MTTPVNRIITRGFGTSRGQAGRAGPVTQGYGGIHQFVISAIQRSNNVKHGQSGRKRRLRELDTIIVWAKLVEVNGSPPKNKIEGFVNVPIDHDRGFAAVMVEHVSSSVRKAWHDLRVTVKRIK